MDRYIFEKGSVHDVDWYVSEHGRTDALEFYRRIPTSARKKLAVMAKFIANHPELPPAAGWWTKVDRKHGIWEFRPSRYRFFYFFFGNAGRIVITNGYMKKSQETPQQELEAARRLKKEYETRHGGLS